MSIKICAMLVIVVFAYVILFSLFNISSKWSRIEEELKQQNDDVDIKKIHNGRWN